MPGKIQFPSYILTLLGLLMITSPLYAAPPITSIPKIDFHTHLYSDVPEFMAMMERLNLRAVTICEGGEDPAILQDWQPHAEHLIKIYPNRLAMCATYDTTRWNEASYVQEALAWLEEAVEAGAVMVKLWKQVGMELKKPDGSYLMPDDPVFDPIYQYLSDNSIPLIAHLADPKAAWLPLDPKSPHYRYYSRNPEWHLYEKEGYPSHEDIMAARDRILARYPDLTFIGAHLGSMAHDLEEIAKRLDEYPNFYVEVAARTGDLSCIPSNEVRDFFLRYQDRILYGSDISAYPDSEGNLDEARRKAITESAERHYRMCWAYYGGNAPVEVHGEVQGLNLPLEVLEKYYYKNALRIVPGLKALDW